MKTTKYGTCPNCTCPNCGAEMQIGDETVEERICDGCAKARKEITARGEPGDAPVNFHAMHTINTMVWVGNHAADAKNLEFILDFASDPNNRIADRAAALRILSINVGCEVAGNRVLPASEETPEDRDLIVRFERGDL